MFVMTLKYGSLKYRLSDVQRFIPAPTVVNVNKNVTSRVLNKINFFGMNVFLGLAIVAYITDTVNIHLSSIFIKLVWVA